MVIDRIEGDVAVIEICPGRFQNESISNIEGAVRDGAVLVKTKVGYAVDESETESRTEAVDALRRSLFSRRNEARDS